MAHYVSTLVSLRHFHSRRPRLHTRQIFISYRCMLMKYALPLIVGTLALAACGQPAEAPTDAVPVAQAVETADINAPVTVTVEDAWCRATPNGAKAGGCYVTIIASGDDTLMGVTSDLADIAQVHEMKHEDGVMKMAHLDNGMPLPAGVRAELKPHGNHIMLMGLKAPLTAGETAKITLSFAKAEDLPVEFAVRTPPVVGGEE